MCTCEWCGKRFEREDAESLFLSETLLSFENLRKCLCGECAVRAIEEQVDGVYFEKCEKCGSTFDLIEDDAKFNGHFSWENGTQLRDYWEPKILCYECAIQKVEDEGYEDLDETENMSVQDAAQIWASYGKDQAYRFGYSEDELEQAL